MMIIKPSAILKTKSFELSKNKRNSLALIGFSLFFFGFMFDAECSLSLSIGNNPFGREDSRPDYSQKNFGYSNNPGRRNNSNDHDNNFGNYDIGNYDSRLVRDYGEENESFYKVNSRNMNSRSNIKTNQRSNKDRYNDGRGDQYNRKRITTNNSNHFDGEQVDSDDYFRNSGRNSVNNGRNGLRRARSAPAILRQDSYINDDRSRSSYNDINRRRSQNSFRGSNNYNNNNYRGYDYYDDTEDERRYGYRPQNYGNSDNMQNIYDAHRKFEDHRRNLVRKGLLACGRILEYLKPLMAESNKRFEIGMNNDTYNGYRQSIRSNGRDRYSGGFRSSYSDRNFLAESEEYNRLLADRRLQKEIAIVADLAQKGQQIERDQKASENNLVAYAEKLSKHTRAVLDMYGCLYKILHNEYPIIAARRMPWIVDV